MSLEQVAADVLRLSVTPFDTINVYILRDTLVDAGVRRFATKILRAIEQRDIRTHLVTHAHPDHQGASHMICQQLGIPLWCGALDAEVMESGDLIRNYPNPRAWAARINARLWGGPPHPVSRQVAEGDEVAGFVVLETPGHTPGHVSLWRERDGVLILGDVVFGMNPFTLTRGLREPPSAFTPSPARNRESARRLAALDPAIVCFGHGPIAPGQVFKRFVATLP
jgi:glyoxylase-like metal-dependent hydrolase (beta-lactamase superfamily II)